MPVDIRRKKIYNDTMMKNERNFETENRIRINKYLSDAGICSRREADRLTDEGRVTINGIPVRTGEKINAEAMVCVDGRAVKKEERKVLILFQKPRGLVFSMKKQGKDPTVTEFIRYPLRIYPVGRLDKESEGLLLLTNQGELVNALMRARNGHEKEYLVSVNRTVTGSFLKKMREGVPILNTVTRPCQVQKTGEKEFRIILTQGLNRQIRRMCEALGYQVLSLRRIRIMNLRGEDLQMGQYREIREEEWKELSSGLGVPESLIMSDTGGRRG